MIVKTFKPQFAPSVSAGRKTQTCRPWPTRKDGTVAERSLPKPWRRLSLRQWQGAAYRSKQRRLRDTLAVRLRPVLVHDGGIVLAGRTLPVHEREAFARADGFASFAAMREWFTREHGGGCWSGYCVEWPREQVA